MDTTEHVHECEWPSHRGDKVDFGCKCTCGAIRHLIGWQAPVVLTSQDEVANTTEYRVVVPGGRGGRDNGFVYQGTDRSTAESWLAGLAPKKPWLEKRTLGPWVRA